jgi:hypothetical protein
VSLYDDPLAYGYPNYVEPVNIFAQPILDTAARIGSDGIAIEDHPVRLASQILPDVAAIF